MGKVKYHIKMIVGNMCIGSSREKKKKEQRKRAYTQDSWGHVNHRVHTLSPVIVPEDTGPHTKSSSTGSSAKSISVRDASADQPFASSQKYYMNGRPPNSCLLPLQDRSRTDGAAFLGFSWRDKGLALAHCPSPQGPTLVPQTLPQEQQELRLYLHLHVPNLYALEITLL